MESLAWTCAVAGLLLGGLASFVPGFPGSAVALLGLVAFAGLTGLEVVGRDALVLAALIAMTGAVGQLSAPFVGSRVLGGTAGAATGAALGAVLGVLLPVPGLGLAGGILGALVLGLVSASDRFLDRFRGALGAGLGCFVSVLVDLLAVVGLGAILAVADYRAVVGS